MTQPFHFFIFVFSIFFTLVQNANAGLLNFNLLNPNDLNSALPQNVADGVIKTFGIYTVHRSYQGASPLILSNSVDLFVEGSMVKFGDALANALDANGIPSSSIKNIPAAPALKLHLVKAINERADLGFSGIFVGPQHIYGFDLKIILSNPEEGITSALRIGYTVSHVPISYVTSCKVWSPELVFSRKLYYAEPYLGFGARFISGTLEVPFSLPAIGPVPAQNFTLTKDGSGITEYAFTGVYFRILGAQGLRLGLEGSFDFSGFHTMGAVVGLGF